jgi:hypothetical protein
LWRPNYVTRCSPSSPIGPGSGCEHFPTLRESYICLTSLLLGPHLQGSLVCSGLPGQGSPASSSSATSPSGLAEYRVPGPEGSWRWNTGLLHLPALLHPLDMWCCTEQSHTHPCRTSSPEEGESKQVNKDDKGTIGEQGGWFYWHWVGFPQIEREREEVGQKERQSRQ